jgi:exonuclease III
VLCLQETKFADKNFPALTFSALGYDSVHFGHNQWNGVAILSRVGLDDPSHGFGAPYVDPYEGDVLVKPPPLRIRLPRQDAIPVSAAAGCTRWRSET